MDWTEHNEVLLPREILNIQPWTNRHINPERKQYWDKIAVILNSLEQPYYQVKTRSVRDRYVLLVNKFKSKVNKENKASGISPEAAEVEALVNLIERFDKI